MAGGADAGAVGVFVEQVGVEVAELLARRRPRVAAAFPFVVDLRVAVAAALLVGSGFVLIVAFYILAELLLNV